MLPLFLGITIISFTVIHLSPGKPTDIYAKFNPKVSPELQKRLIKLYNLDKPLYVQYWMWLKALVKLDFGRSFTPDARAVWDKIKERLPITIGINALAMFFIIAVAIPLGVTAAVKHNSFFDKITTIFVFIGYATPTFWLALLLMMLFGIELGWLPLSGIKSLDYEGMRTWAKVIDLTKHLILPVFVSAFGSLAGLSRFVRSTMLEVIRQDYIFTARAKGLPERVVIYKHALKNALLPVITILGLSVPGLIGGSVIFESVFAIPGMGQLFYLSVMSRDYPTIMGCLVIGAILTLLGNLLADISYALVDPRIRVS
jgi:peptide/nickel transport system permease protein